MALLPVIYSPLAERHLGELRRYIETDSGTIRADRFVDSIIDYCDGLAVFPERGTRRDDLVAGLRLIGYRRRATIAFTIEPQGVVIQGVYYRGRDFEAELDEETE